MARSKAEIRDLVQREDVQYIRLIFTDLSGILKNVEIPVSQLERMLDNNVAFDGSSVEGFVRIIESDMLLHPDLDTFRIATWEHSQTGKVAACFCTVCGQDGQPFEGDGRVVLMRAVERMKAAGFSSFHIGFEPEFYLLKTDECGRPIIEQTDSGSYFDLAPIDTQVDCRRAIIHELIKAGFEVEAGHHEVGPGQHEINFMHADVVSSCDQVLLFKLIVKNVAKRFGVHATFMPKPKQGIAGSGMHTNMSLFDAEGKNAFYDPQGRMQLSDITYQFIAGVMEHVIGFCAVTNPTVNSYKRLVSGYEAPCYVAYSDRNRSALIRIPAPRGSRTRCELRMVDPTCNPYLAMAVVLEAGMDGIQRKLEPKEPMHVDLFSLSHDEREALGVRELPRNLMEAYEAMAHSQLVRHVFGESLFQKFLRSREMEWNEYRQYVSSWEVQKYCERF